MKKYKESGAADEFKQKKKQAERERKAADKKAKGPATKKVTTLFFTSFFSISSFVFLLISLLN